MNTCPTCHRERYVGESCQRVACIWADLAGVALELDERPPESVTLYATPSDFLAAVNNEVVA